MTTQMPLGNAPDDSPVCECPHTWDAKKKRVYQDALGDYGVIDDPNDIDYLRCWVHEPRGHYEHD